MLQEVKSGLKWPGSHSSGVVINAYNLGMLKAEAGGILQVWDQPGITEGDRFSKENKIPHKKIPPNWNHNFNLSMNW